MIILQEDLGLNPITLIIKYGKTTYKELSQQLGYSIEELKELEKLKGEDLPLPFQKALSLYTKLLKTKLAIKDIYSKINV